MTTLDERHGEGAGDDPAALRRAWRDLSDSGALPLVVRSSSPQEDTEQSSLAGQFASVLDVRGWSAFATAVRTVLDSAHRPDGSTAPMAVLVQPMLRARVGGVMFGADPVEGRADRMLVSAVRGGPDSLVSGEQAGTNYWLSRRGRLLRTEPPTADALLTRSELRRLARLARRARHPTCGGAGNCRRAGCRVPETPARNSRRSRRPSGEHRVSLPSGEHRAPLPSSRHRPPDRAGRATPATGCRAERRTTAHP